MGRHDVEDEDTTTPDVGDVKSGGLLELAPGASWELVTAYDIVVVVVVVVEVVTKLLGQVLLLLNVGFEMPGSKAKGLLSIMYGYLYAAGEFLKIFSASGTVHVAPNASTWDCMDGSYELPFPSISIVALSKVLQRPHTFPV